MEEKELCMKCRDIVCKRCFREFVRKPYGDYEESECLLYFTYQYGLFVGVVNDDDFDCEKIKVVQLHGCGVSDETLGNILSLFKDMKNLEYLDLMNNNLNEKSLDLLKELKHVKYINVLFNKKLVDYVNNEFERGNDLLDVESPKIVAWEFLKKMDEFDNGFKYKLPMSILYYI